MAKFLFYSLVFLFAFLKLSSGNSTDSCFLLKLKPSGRSSLFLFTAGYKMPLNKNKIINSGHGFYFEGGINPGYFISKKTLIGVYAGWAWKDGLWSTSFNKDFIRDYKNAINASDVKYAGIDSSVIFSSKEVLANNNGRSATLPGCEMRSFHNYSLYYGIVFRLPIKYSPVVKLYIGTTRSHFQGKGGLATQNKEYNIYELRRNMYGCEFVFFRGVHNMIATGDREIHRYFGALSVYYELCDFYNSSLYFDDGDNTIKRPLRSFTSQAFLQKYRTEHAWGIKLSFCIL
jgi:hypothetical protein